MHITTHHLAQPQGGFGVLADHVRCKPRIVVMAGKSWVMWVSSHSWGEWGCIFWTDQGGSLRMLKTPNEDLHQFNDSQWYKVLPVPLVLCVILTLVATPPALMSCLAFWSQAISSPMSNPNWAPKVSRVQNSLEGILKLESRKQDQKLRPNTQHF